MNYQWDNKKPTAQMLGRWQPFHDGHYALFKEIIKKTGQVCIQIRDVQGVEDNPFDFTMRSVLVAQQGLVSSVKNNSIFSTTSVKQDKSKEVRYTKNIDFTDDVAKEFLDRNLELSSVSFSYPNLLNPIFS